MGGAYEGSNNRGSKDVVFFNTIYYLKYKTFTVYYWGAYETGVTPLQWTFYACSKEETCKWINQSWRNVFLVIVVAVNGDYMKNNDIARCKTLIRLLLVHCASDLLESASDVLDNREEMFHVQLRKYYLSEKSNAGSPTSQR